MTTLTLVGFFILAILLQLFALLLVFLYGLSRTFGAALLIITAVVSGFIAPWSLLLGVPLISFIL